MADTSARKPRKSTATLSDIELEALKATKAELEDKRPELAKLAPLRQRSQEAPASEITSAKAGG